MRLTYDPHANAVYVKLVGGVIPIAKTLSGDSPDIARIMGFMNFDFDVNGHIVGIEVLNADQILPIRLIRS